LIDWGYSVWEYGRNRNDFSTLVFAVEMDVQV